MDYIWGYRVFRIYIKKVSKELGGIIGGGFDPIYLIAQRLVRKLCDKCKEAYFPTEEEVKHISTEPKVQEQLMKTKLYKKKGCKECGYLGYTGRLGIYEVMPISREIKKLIAQGAHDIEIEEAAVAAGMKTLKFSCLKHIMDGVTTTSEFIRVLGYASD